MIDLLIGTERVRLSDRDLLGVGGEARVYRCGPTRAAKVYHPTLSPPALARRIEKLRHFPRGLPPELSAPLALARDAQTDSPVGFVMPLVAGEEIRRLGKRSWRDGRVSSASVNGLFQRLAGVLGGLHRAGVVVGDLNDGNVLFEAHQPRGPIPWLIDADSVQFGAYPCPVAHPLFLDPDLFSVDLAAAPAFKPANDWHAFAVLFFQSLLYVHPYGGVHPTLPTLLRRAEARVTVLDADVSLPKVAAPPAVLPEPLKSWLEGVLGRGEREAPSADVFGAAWRRCRCGIEHARSLCPECRSRPTPASRSMSTSTSTSTGSSPVTVTRGRCIARSVVQGADRVHAVALQGRLRWLIERDGALRREDGSVVAAPVNPQTRFAIDRERTWAGQGEQLSAWVGGRVVERASTTTFAGASAFASDAGPTVRLAGDWLVELTTGRRLGSALGGQTWLAAGHGLGFGFYRAGLFTNWFVFDPRKPGLRPVALPDLGNARLLDVQATFSGTGVALRLDIERADTSREQRLYLVSPKGAVRATLVVPDGSLGPIALAGERLLVVAPDGLRLFEPGAPGGQLTERAHFPDTEPFVAGCIELLAAPDGSLVVATPRAITTLTLSA